MRQNSGSKLLGSPWERGTGILKLFSEPRSHSFCAGWTPPSSGLSSLGSPVLGMRPEQGGRLVPHLRYHQLREKQHDLYICIVHLTVFASFLFVCLIAVVPGRWGRENHFHFTDEETEGQREEMASSRAHSWQHSTEQRQKFKAPLSMMP